MLLVSEAGYYCWLRTLTRPDKYDDLLAKIRQICAENKDYGAYRIYLALPLFHGYTGTYYVILKLCKTHPLMLKKKYHAKGITKADPTAQASENLIQQDFSAAAPNQKWLGDITEIPTADGKLYLNAVLDCYDGAIVGFKMAKPMRADLCVNARWPPSSIKLMGCGFIVIETANIPVRCIGKRLPGMGRCKVGVIPEDAMITREWGPFLPH